MPENEILYDESYLSALESDSTDLGSDYDPDANYADPPPPLPDGFHRAYLKNIGAKDAEGNLRPFTGPRAWGPQVPVTFFTQVEGIITDPGGKTDGLRTNRFNVTTHIEPRRNNTSSAAMVYRAITGDPIPGTKQGGHMGAIVEHLQGQQPVVWVKTQLTGVAPDADKAFQQRKQTAKNLGQPAPKDGPATIRGEGKFKFTGAFDDDGKPVYGEKVTGMAYDLKAGETVVGRPEIVEMQPLSFTPPGVSK